MAQDTLFNFSITVPTPSEYKRKQVYRIFTGWKCESEISSTPDTLTIKFKNIPENDCESYKCIALLRIPHPKGTPRHYIYKKEPID
jgi:hypothetical protein